MNNQTFTPQFPAATLEPTYIRIMVKGTKAYVPVISIRGKVTKPTHKKCKTATGALAYSKVVIARYRSMIDVTILSLASVPAEA